MSGNSITDWENLVQKQLKTDDIYSVLSKDNLEGVKVKPYYAEVAKPTSILPRAEESTQLVAPYHEDLEEEVYAFLLDENVENLTGKVIFINNKELAEHIIAEEENRYISLIDVFSDDEKGELNEQLARELHEKSFERNIGIDVSLHQNAGASIVQQLAIALAKTKDLAEIFGEEILDKLTFRFAVGSNYFFEIAKIRAFKLLFAQLTSEYGVKQCPYIFAETTLRNKSKFDAENNLIRSTMELSAAMIGGADAVFSKSYDLTDKKSSEEISFKQQIVLAYESIINVFDDAGNGSYYVEEITRQFCEKAWQLFLDIEQSGGYCESLKTGKIQEIIYDHAVLEQKWVEQGKIKLIGVNLYPKLEVTTTVEQLYDKKIIKPVRLSEMFE